MIPNAPAHARPEIPKIIWILWLQGIENAPPLVQKCAASWQKYNPDWKIVVLNEQNMLDHVEIPKAIMENCAKVSRQAVSEVLRINLLARHGGVWADATCLCCKPLNEWLGDYLSSGFFAFVKPGRDRLISSWFLAGDPGCHLVQAYCRMINDYFTLNSRPLKGRVARRIAKIIERLFKKRARSASWLVYPRAVKIFPVNPYFWMHYTFYRLVHEDAASRQLWEAMPKFSADGPRDMQRRGFNPVSAEVKDILARRRDPVYKLNWRKTDWPPGSVLEYLLATV